MIQRKTQTADHWKSFTLTPADVAFLHDLLVDSGQPASTPSLALALVAERCRREESDLRAELSKGTVYQPRLGFSVGDRVIFPSMDFRPGTVKAIRSGENPEYGDFDVITIDFGPDRRQRAFAARLQSAHRLNSESPELMLFGEGASPETLLETVAAGLPAQLSAALAAHPSFARFEDHWFLRDLMTEVHVGHLNIAEALVEMRGAPLETDLLLKELDLPGELAPDVAEFSLGSALAGDQRFDQVGPGDTRRWYLRRLAPPEALESPEPLRYAPVPYDRELLTPELLQIEWELDDEWSDGPPGGVASVRAKIPTATLNLTYPHAVSGTLPLNSRSRLMFPQGRGDRTMVTLVDGRWGQRFPAWIVHEGRYIAGLRSWFEQHKLPAGAFIVLEVRDGSDEIVVDFRPRRMRREWARWAQVTDENRLDIQLRKQEVACEYDEAMIIGVDRPADLLRLRNSAAYADAPLSELVYQICVDLAGLNQQGTVHAKTVYGTINVVRRLPPGPIFAVLASDERYQEVAGGEFKLAV